MGVFKKKPKHPLDKFYREMGLNRKCRRCIELHHQGRNKAKGCSHCLL